jgi:RHS repeat-associated protein
VLFLHGLRIHRVVRDLSEDSDVIPFDGVNAVQEVSGRTPVVNRLTGGVDEFFARSDATGTTFPLTDALGSTIALTDATGNIQTQYTYEPFGGTTPSSTTSANSYQFTGRVNDGTGLYYYRARYYSPRYQQFISEDPLGFRGGINIYMYGGNNPISRIDPYGLDWLNDLADFSAGAGSALTFGLTDAINNATGASSVVNKCSGWHALGTATGIGLTTAIGGAAGAEAAEANAGEKGYEFSHWIPDRMGGPRSIFNGNYVSSKFHYLTDFYRYPTGYQAWGPKLPAVVQQLLRIPWVYDGAAAGAAYGAASTMGGRKNQCH